MVTYDLIEIVRKMMKLDNKTKSSIIATKQVKRNTASMGYFIYRK